MIGTFEWHALSLAYPITKELPHQFVRILREDCVALKIYDGGSLFELGATAKAFPFITDGEAVVSRPRDGLHEMVLYRVGPGDACALTTACLLGERRYPGKAQVTAMLRGFHLRRSGFLALLEGSEPFREFVFGAVAGRLAQLMSLVGEVAFDRLDARVASLILAHATTIRRSHQQLADELGSTREAVTRALATLQRRGFVRLGRCRIDIVDRPGLAAAQGGYVLRRSL